jgi:hypothetical protein
MQQDILPTTKKVAENAKFVSINKDAVEKFCNSFSLDNAAMVELGNAHQFDISEQISLVCAFNCVNFCFWAAKGQEKWATKINGELIDGATGMLRALEEAYKNGAPLLDAHFLQNLNREKFNKLLNGNIEIPLLGERVKCLNEAGEVLIKNFDGSFMKVFEAANGDVIELTNLFINFFSSFNDYATFEGEKIEFHKRAQLNTAMINYRLTKRGEKELSNLDKLTAFADYKVPQMLRKFGILEYIPELAVKIDSYMEIEAGSREEVEIRAATIWAIEQMKEALVPRFPQITARQLDDHLWSLGQTKSPDDKPYHRTKTIYY